MPADMGVQDNSFNLNKGNRSTLYSLDIFALPVEHGIALPLHKRGKNDRAHPTVVCVCVCVFVCLCETARASSVKRLCRGESG